jgi:N-acylneuraminate cytidylyltransferase
MVPLLGVPGLDEPYNAPRQVLPAVYWQTGHIDAIRSSTILGKGSMTGDIIFPITIDPRFTVDLDTPSDWAKAEWLVTNGRLDFVTPGKSPRPMPKRIELLVMDFDGVLTDNRVWTDPDGREMVASNRSDSYGLGLLRTSGIESVVISKETNPVVSTRCKKIGIPVLQGIDDKEAALRGLLEKRGIDPACVVYIGNDINDLTCFHLVGWAVTVPDAMPEAIRQADYVLSHNGGHGAVRELCDLILQYKRG